MATKRRRHLAVDASNFVTVQHVRENHTFSVIAKVMSKSGVMKFDCLHSYLLLCVFFSSALMEFLSLCLQWFFTRVFEMRSLSHQGHVQTESLGHGLMCKTANMATSCG